MAFDDVLRDAQKFMSDEDIDGWLLYDYRGVNPIFWDTVGNVSNVTRPCWLWIPKNELPVMLVSYVDQGRFAHLNVKTELFHNRSSMVAGVATLLKGKRRVAMEYSPRGQLPRVSRVDAGIVELVRGEGVDVVSSCDVAQYATQRLTTTQLESHFAAAAKLDGIVLEAFCLVGDEKGASEYDVAEFIRRRFREEELVVTDGPIVAANEHASDPHFDPSPDVAVEFELGNWVLIDLWARLEGEDTMFADITWTGFIGDQVPEAHQMAFDVVIGARDAALAEIEDSFAAGRPLQGWEVDKVARDHIVRAGYGGYFNHRLGHSLGREVHGNAVNLDGWETHDTRQLIPDIVLTIEPGVYLPEFGVRSEIDVYIAEEGPRVTTEVQREIVLIPQP